MADPRTFVLIGDFQDNITPALESINKTINSFKRNMASMATKRGGGYGDVTTAVGKLVSAQIHLKEAIEGVGKAARAATDDLREYKSVMGKVASAHTAIQRSGTAMGKSQKTFWQTAEKDLDDYRRKLEALQRQTKINPYRSMPSPGSRRGGGGYGGMMPPPVAAAPRGGGPPRPPRGGGGGGGGGMGAHMAEFGFAYTLGNAIAQPIQSAITQGFQIGIGMMTKPFQYFGDAFGERVKDEISDLKAAGGFLSISKRSKNPFVKDIDEAIEFQQKTNETFAKMAGALPGVTNDYVQVGKRLGDTAARIVEQDFGKALTRANEIRATAEGRKFYGGQITGTGAEAQQQVITTILGELTKKTTIAGLGGRTGAGGVAGAYGLPGLTERMLSEDKVSMGKFQRYAAVFSDPTVADALDRNVDKINATAKNSMERTDAVNKLLDEIVTPELIDKLRTSVDGVYQGLKSVIFDPDSGLFGLGRNFKEFGYKINSYGQYVNKAGKVVDDITKAAKVDLSIFEVLRDVFANLGAALLPLAEGLKYVFDPLQSVSKVLMDARHYAAQFNQVFNQYRQGLMNMAKIGRSEKFEETIDLRASLATINNFLRQFGVISKEQFKTTGIELMAENLDIGQMMSKLVDQVLNSKIAEKVGTLIGEVIGTVLTEVAKVTGFISGRVTGGNKLFKGLSAGFDKAKGVEAFKNIFKDVFNALISALGQVMKMIPMEAYFVMAAMVVLPAAVQGLGMKIAESILAGITGLGNNLEKTIPGQVVKGGGRVFGGGGAAARRMGGLGSMFLPGYGMQAAQNFRKKNFGPKIDDLVGDTNFHKALEIPPRYATIAELGRKKDRFFDTKGYSSPIGPTPRGKAGQAVNGGYLPSQALRGRGAGLAAGLGRAGRFMPGPAALAFGGVDAAVRMASGQDAGKALGGAAASVIGSTLGGILGQTLIPIPGVGAALGGIAGGIIGDKLFTMISGPSAEQKQAAALQMQAAIQQKQAADLGKSGVDIGGAGGAFLFGKADELSKRLSELGLSANASVRSFENLYRLDQGKQKAAQEAASALNVEITRLKNLGRPQAEIAARVRGLQSTYDKAKIEAETSLTNLNKTWKNLGPKTTEQILNSFKNMPVGQVEAAIAERIRKADGAGTTGDPNRNRRENVGVGGYDAYLAEMRSKGIGPVSYEVWKRQNSYAFGSPGKSFSNLVAAANYESKHKPAGSKLGVFNTSETVIPAAGGYGMADFIDTLRWGFGAMMSAYRQAQQKQDSLLNGINQTLKINQQQTNTRLSAMEKKFSTPGMTGGLGGGAAGGVDAFTGMAQGYGLQLTSGYRPGDPGWHGANRARDFSNGTGPTPQMMQFAQFLASNYGQNLKELIYTPLGFSIKNGQRVAPYAQGSHYNHVHVAYGLGQGNPAFFGSQSAAERWERSMVSGSVRVGSVTGNSAEGFGSGTSVVNNITINQQPGQNAEELASIVALKISEAVSDARAASIFV
jgi:hypothetical protein